MIRQATSALSDSPSVVVLPCVSGLADVSDGELLELQRQSGAARRQVDAVVAAISGEVARRSDRSLGHDGLAARTGAATPEKAVQALTGVSHSEARALVAAGAALGDGSPWLTPVADAPIDTGHTQRLHTVAQRVALAAQWNGCPVGNCDRPPGMTEIHHIEPWNGSNTTIDNGISLCRFHHMELHANGWSIAKLGDGTLWFTPPTDSVAAPLPITSRSPFAQPARLAAARP